MSRLLDVSIESFSYEPVKLLENVNFFLYPGEHLSILGESGSGKSTILHLIYGLLPLKKGIITYDGKKSPGPSDLLIPGAPFMKLVSQESDLIPYSTVSENIASHIPPLELENRNVRVKELLALVALIEFKDRQVKNLSGGQKQRVALAKALAHEPEILLLDEAFSNFDLPTKNRLRRNLFEYLKQKQISVITATHDSDEALSFSDKLILLQSGKVKLYGTPQQVYFDVKTVEEARYFAEANELPGEYFGETTGENIVLYAHQLEAVEKDSANIEVKIGNSYFKGSHYLIQSYFQGREIFFYHPDSLQKNTWIGVRKIP